MYTQLKFIACLAIALVNTASATAQCKCELTAGENRWSQIEMRIGTATPKKFNCGYQFSIACTDTVRLTAGTYSCYGGCVAAYKARILQGTTVVRTLDPFVFSTAPIVFTRPGSYKLELVAVCNNNFCKTCSFFFTVADRGCTR
jgi:hypothetical protein